MDQALFREAMARWPSGVTVVACRHDGRAVATTVSAFFSLSLDPPLVLTALGRNATVLPFLEPAARFGISMLGAAQRRLATAFADPFQVIADPFAASDPPLIADAPVQLQCIVHESRLAGDHTLIVAGVQAVQFNDAAPLVRYRRRYHEIASR